MKGIFSDKILFLKVIKQDPEAYGQFYDLYVDRIHRFIFFKVNSTSDAQDLTSETFLKLWQSLKEGKEIKNLNSFVYTIARNLVIDFYRKRATHEQESIDRDEVREIPDKTNFLHQQEVDDQLQGVLRGLDKLKDEYREVIVLRFLNELSISEISAVINKSGGSVRVLLHRAMKALKESI
jgi:RNA polymerase sigma-70 factor (ECF subfamily)